MRPAVPEAEAPVVTCVPFQYKPLPSAYKACVVVAGVELEMVTPFVETVRPVKVVVAALKVPATDAFPVVFNVATWRLPVPVAPVKVTPAKAETPEMFKEPPLTKPEAVKLVDETAAKDERPETLSVAPFTNPEEVKFVEDTAARDERPEIFKVAPFKNPEAVMLVEETLASVDVPVTVALPTTCKVVLAVAEVPRARALETLSQLKRALELNPPEPLLN